jgi:hypothetical protein
MPGLGKGIRASADYYGVVWYKYDQINSRVEEVVNLTLDSA